jgi:D-threonate/D-erythronate kinase
MMAMIDRLVIADDLTGANDTGVHFIEPGHHVSVVVDSDGVDPDTIGPRGYSGTVVLNTNTRFSSAADAYERVLREVKRFGTHQPGVILKKIDSTLRGNIGSEIDAVMTAGGFSLACVASASPRNGRTVVHGICYVNGVPLNQTEIARDPFTPVTQADVRRIIESQTSRKTGLLPLEILRNTKREILAHLESLIKDHVEIVVTDAKTIEDLRTVFRVFASQSQPVLLVGSAGLFHAASILHRHRSKELVQHHIRDEENGRSGKALFVIGSLMNTTLRQTERLVQDAGIKRLTLKVNNLIENHDGEVERLIGALHDGFSREDVLILQTSQPSRENDLPGDLVGPALGDVVAGLLRVLRIDAIIATGGDTAHKILTALSVRVCSLVDEAAPGIPVATIEHEGRSMTTIFVTKAGSFGDEDAFTRVLHYLGGNRKSGVTK